MIKINRRDKKNIYTLSGRYKIERENANVLRLFQASTVLRPRLQVVTSGGVTVKEWK